ncbi:hypothetical protein [Niveispirillum sp. KHB5.9]|uniref:hypothetical protein n=1 Tax=Niveispirillum sp. KHB5.9 TaxID=3400269 RepID=UPI003A877855
MPVPRTLTAWVLLLCLPLLAGCTGGLAPCDAAFSKRQLWNMPPDIAAARVMAQVTGRLDPEPARRKGRQPTQVLESWFADMKPVSTAFAGLCRRAWLHVGFEPVGQVPVDADADTPVQARILNVTRRYAMLATPAPMAWPEPEYQGRRTDCTGMPSNGFDMFTADDDDTAAAGHWLTARVGEALAAGRALPLTLECSQPKDWKGPSCLEEVVRDVRPDRLREVVALDTVSRCADGLPGRGSYRCYRLDFTETVLLAVVDLTRVMREGPAGIVRLEASQQIVLWHERVE